MRVSVKSGVVKFQATATEIAKLQGALDVLRSMALCGRTSPAIEALETEIKFLQGVSDGQEQG